MNLDRYTEKAAEAGWNYTASRYECGFAWDEVPEGIKEGSRNRTRAALAAVYDDIRADVAEEIAAKIAAGPSCGVSYRDHEGCYVADALQVARDHATSHTSAAETPAAPTTGDSATQGGSEAQRGAQPVCPPGQCAGLDEFRGEGK